MAESASQRFNRLLGNRTGRRQSGWRPRPNRFVAANPAMRINRIARGSPSIPSRITREYNRRVRPVGGRTSYSTPSNVGDLWGNVYDDLVDQYVQSNAEQAAVNVAQGEESERDYPWYQDAINTITGIGPGSFQESAIGRGIDVFSRPFYALAEGMQSVAEKEESDYEGSNMGWGAFTEDVRDIASGFWRGLSGKDKTGFGQVYEALKENETMGAGFLRDLEESHPAVESWLSRGVGLAGELFLDPLNFTMPAAPRILRGTNELATEDTITRYLTNAVEDTTDDFIANSGVIGRHPIYSQNPQLLVDRLNNTLADTVNDAIVNVAGGGGRKVQLMNDRYWPTTVANRGEQELREAMTETFIERVNHTFSQASSGRLTTGTVDAFRNTYQDFDEFWTKLEAQLTNLNKLPANSTTDDLVDLLNTGGVSRRLVDSIIDDVTSIYNTPLEHARGEIFAAANNPTYRTVGVRVGSKVVPFKTVGRAFDWFTTKLDNVFPNHGNLFSQTFENTFPGIFALKTGRARALGFNVMDEFRKEVQERARAFTREEAGELQRLLEKGLPSPDPKMQDALNYIRQKYDDIFLEEQIAGARSRRNVRGDNYIYIYNRGGDRKARTLFKNERKKAWNDPAVVGPGQYDLLKAQQMGLRPIDNAFENLFMRYTKSRRDMVRTLFLNDLVENYSIFGGKPVRRLKDADLTRRGLKEVSVEDLSDSFRAMADKTNGRFYLPEPIWDMNEKFRELSSWTSQDFDRLGRDFAKIINQLKVALTIPYPGFHMKNMIGDVFMGLLDDINPSDYAMVMKSRLAKMAGKPGVIPIRVPGMRYTFDDMMREYLTHADAGFFNVEMGTYESLTAGAIPKRMGRRVTNKVRDLADTREMMPRFVHFTTAFKDEAEALWRRGIRDLDVIERRAADAALWRVNHFKFDYSALMPFEKKMKTLAFPFYTYLRKALPVLLEQMYTNPHYFSSINRFMEYNDGSAADNFNADNIPQWIRDIGFGILDDSENPMAVTADILPFGALDILSSNNAQEFSQNLVSNLNPLAIAPFELAADRTFFDDRPIESTGEYLTRKIPLVGDIQEELGVNIPGLPGRVGDPLWDQIFSEQGLRNRLGGLGLPFRRISAGQQQQQQNENLDRLIEDPIQDFNYSQDQYTITITDDFQYKVNYKGGETIAILATPQAAIEYAQSLPGAGYQQPRISPYQAPTGQDVQSILNEMLGL